MTLDASYTKYPKRRHCYDHELYTWSAMHERKPVDWGAGRKVAIWLCVSLEWCDWVNDELPYRFNNGLINLPLNHELSDRQIITVQQKSADSYAESMRDAYDWLAKEAAQFGGRMLPMHITPYIIGLPYRIDAFEKLLGDLQARDDAWFATGGEIVDAWEKQL